MKLGNIRIGGLTINTAYLSTQGAESDLVCLSDLLGLHTYVVWVLLLVLADLAVGTEVVLYVPLCSELAIKGLYGPLAVKVIGRDGRRGYNREPHYHR